MKESFVVVEVLCELDPALVVGEGGVVGVAADDDAHGGDGGRERELLSQEFRL